MLARLEGGPSPFCDARVALEQFGSPRSPPSMRDSQSMRERFLLKVNVFLSWEGHPSFWYKFSPLALRQRNMRESRDTVKGICLKRMFGSGVVEKSLRHYSIYRKFYPIGTLCE